ncbi:transport SFT2 [Fusarium circinatum]|uniref:Protein transport protein SFT2 n=1 Tax=Fusarium circinatum TaxID=48490 RepID=A0A8H5SSE8_FUSCI|nr:transport SFT2 [Fusarium circinatum]
MISLKISETSSSANASERTAITGIDGIQSKESTTRPTPTHQLPSLVPPSTINDQLHSSPNAPNAPIDHSPHSLLFGAQHTLVDSCHAFAFALIATTFAIFQRNIVNDKSKLYRRQIAPESGSHPEPEPAPHDRPSRSVPVPRSLNLSLTFPPLWSPVAMASSSFRHSINSLGWSRRDEPVNTSQQSGLLSSLQSLNPFQGGSGYVRLPTTESSGAPLPAPTRREEEEGWFVLSRWDRLLIFGACNLAAVACFVICFTLFPVLSLRPRKFVILWSVGSLMFLASFAAVMGPMNYVYHLLSTPRLPFTAAYFGSITLTLVFALKLFPYGIYWAALCHIVWCKASNSMDDWLEKSVDYM